MSNYKTEIYGLEPKYSERDNLDRGERLTVTEIETNVVDQKTGRSGYRASYTVTHRVAESGNIRLKSLDRRKEQDISATALARVLSKAEDAIDRWARHEDSDFLTLVPYWKLLSEEYQDHEAPPITNEARCAEMSDDG